jgi:hypothetical protein
MTRLPFLPSNAPRPPVEGNFWRGVLRASLISVFLWCGIALLLGCSPRAFTEVNKQAPEPPYMGARHSGLDRAEYLRVTEPLEVVE